MLNIVYQIISFILSLIAFPFFYGNRRGRFKIEERYGYWGSVIRDGQVIWIHAASFGEVNAITPFIELLKNKFPKFKILITVTSDTGYNKALKIADYVHICPFDNYIWLKQALHKINIKYFIVTETEIWPAMLSYISGRRIPAFLINARISDYTLGIYRNLKFFISPLLNQFHKLCVINHESEERFIALGVNKALISVSGYSKYDIEPQVKSKNEAEIIRKNYFDNLFPVITLGSIRPNEEKIWFPAVKKAILKNLKFNLIVAPRHQDKFTYFAEKLSENGLDYIKYTELKIPSHKTILLDTMGKLSQAYSFSDLAFIGASLVNIGGHNPLEPACYQCAICIGPYYNNVREIVERLLNKNAITVIDNTEEAYQLICKAADRNSELADSSKNANLIYQENFGSSMKIINSLGIK